MAEKTHTDSGHLGDDVADSHQRGPLFGTGTNVTGDHAVNPVDVSEHLTIDVSEHLTTAYQPLYGRWRLVGGCTMPKKGFGDMPA